MTNHRIIPLPEPKHYQGFTLDIENPNINLLADEHELVLNLETGHFTLINWDIRYIAADGTFELEELPLILSLLTAWPTYVPVEKLLMASQHIGLEAINQASESERDRMHLKLRCCIAECQQKIHHLGIDIQIIGGSLGYKLSRYYKQE